MKNTHVMSKKTKIDRKKRFKKSYYERRDEAQL